mgnify:CR=1 FL=1
MSITRIGAGKRMSEAVIHGGKAYLAGFVAEKTVGKSVKEQTADILAQSDATLKQAGTDKTKLLSATIFLPSMTDFAAMNAVWEAWVPQGHTPARATVEAKLASPDYKVEIHAIAAL